ncbi:hypothetical protein K3X13_08985 [Aliiroseovarius crassostreae]|uniref:hypothetical protein n=1 Tax=Aliiroseovarius crassostreae TaxID=154981 RepID=UPI0021FF1A54|nr:hypothetical protein [Aliiroseovarius crassostreae]UWP91225.1 hypothetical protein K3X13_08985 [Aliiroseovarius crassostreae]
MKQAFALMMVIAVVLQLGYLWAGYEAIYQIGYGAITLMGLMISLTFLWLYVVRATPLALGMAYSWSGASLVLGWWWVFSVLGEPAWAAESPAHFLFLSLYLVGALLHFSVINRSFGLHGAMFLWPVLGAVCLSGLIYIIT